ncbi:MAG: methyltransferase domain-containing protein [Deltaproteobacteria bacterium]|nr:methyltransferase domain-containing protein [Deltaproteobacteria bacterium]
MEKHSNDRALRFYQEVLGLERLHYGLWRPEDELSLANLKAAQKRYEDLIVENLPDRIRSIIDVGCGTGVLLSRLKRMGFQAEGLTPDRNQQQLMQAQGLAPIHHCRFEEFQPQSGYDCVVMSESAQYIPLAGFFGGVRTTLNPGGHLLVCDYFVLDGARGILAKSGHNYECFLKAAQREGFRLAKSRDLTGEVLKTLELAKVTAEKIRLALEIGTEKFRDRHPFWTRLIKLFCRKKYLRLQEEMVLIDAQEFAKNKTYQFLLFECREVAQEAS